MSARKSKNINKEETNPVKEARKALNMTQEKFVELLINPKGEPVSTSYLSQVENGKPGKFLSTDNLKRIADKTGFSMDYLTGRSPYKTEEEKRQSEFYEQFMNTIEDSETAILMRQKVAELNEGLISVLAYRKEYKASLERDDKGDPIGFRFTGFDGETTLIKSDELNRFFVEIKDYALYRFEKMIRDTQRLELLKKLGASDMVSDMSNRIYPGSDLETLQILKQMSKEEIWNMAKGGVESNGKE